MGDRRWSGPLRTHRESSWARAPRPWKSKLSLPISIGFGRRFFLRWCEHWSSVSMLDPGEQAGVWRFLIKCTRNSSGHGNELLTNVRFCGTFTYLVTCNMFAENSFSRETATNFGERGEVSNERKGEMWEEHCVPWPLATLAYEAHYSIKGYINGTSSDILLLWSPLSLYISNCMQYAQRTSLFWVKKPAARLNQTALDMLPVALMLHPHPALKRLQSGCGNSIGTWHLHMSHLDGDSTSNILAFVRVNDIHFGWFPFSFSCPGWGP